jgi:hypothetical protein
LYGFQHVSSCQVDCRCKPIVEIHNFRLVGGNQCFYDGENTSARKIMGFKRLGGDDSVIESRLHRHNFAANDDFWVDFPKRHSNEIENSNACTRHFGLDPKRKEAKKDTEADEKEEANKANSDNCNYISRQHISQNLIKDKKHPKCPQCNRNRVVLQETRNLKRIVTSKGPEVS